MWDVLIFGYICDIMQKIRILYSYCTPAVAAPPPTAPPPLKFAWQLITL